MGLQPLQQWEYWGLRFDFAVFTLARCSSVVRRHKRGAYLGRRRYATASRMVHTRAEPGLESRENERGRRRKREKERERRESALNSSRGTSRRIEGLRRGVYGVCARVDTRRRRVQRVCTRRTWTGPKSTTIEEKRAAFTLRSRGTGKADKQPY